MNEAYKREMNCIFMMAVIYSRFILNDTTKGAKRGSKAHFC